MEIRTINNRELAVAGIIKTIDDSMALREAIQKLVEEGADTLTLRIEDSFAMPSAVIGYLMKLVNRDKVRLTLLASDQRLCDLLEELQLTGTFGVRCTGK